MDLQIQGINKLGDYIIDLNGQKILLNPISKKKAKQAVFNAYQRVIENYPDSEWTVEAYKNQSNL